MKLSKMKRGHPAMINCTVTLNVIFFSKPIVKILLSFKIADNIKSITKEMVECVKGAQPPCT